MRGALRILTEGALSSAAMGAMLDEFDRALERDGYELRLDADGELDAAERTTLESLAERLGVSQAQLETLLG